ncbi:MAG: hypothetical protein ACSHXW_04400 [Yoonia sp.]
MLELSLIWLGFRNSFCAIGRMWLLPLLGNLLPASPAVSLLSSLNSASGHRKDTRKNCMFMGHIMQPFEVTQQKRNAQFEAFRSGDAADTNDVLARLAVVLVCGFALWFATGQTIMLLWSIGYWLMTIPYVFWFLRRKSGDARGGPRGLILCRKARPSQLPGYAGPLFPDNSQLTGNLRRIRDF